MARTSSVSPSITRTPQVKALVAASWPKVSDRSAPTYELGDLLLSSFKLAPVQPTQRRTKRSQSHGVMILEGSLALISWITLLRGGLPRRIYDLVGGIFLVSSAGICYLSVCHLLRKVSSTKYISELLLDRSNPRSWPREKRRLFLEVCTWMAIVLLLYITTHSSWIAILAGALVAAVLAFVSDFLAASLYLLETKQEPQHMKSIGGMLWLKVALSYGCVGYIISDTGRMLHTYVFGQEETKQQLESLHQLVFNYLLITLVGASLIIASELLLLCTPTRRAGIVLQSRIVDARKNWEQHSLRSLVEVTGTFGTTILYYSSTRDMLVSLQLGTCCGVLLILGSELLASACTSHFVSPPSPQAAVEMPADHWVKLIPVIVMMLYFALQLYAAIVRAANQPSSSLVLMLCFVAIAAIMLTGLALSGRKPSLLEVTRSGRRLAAKICVGLITLIAPKVSYGWSGVIFSCVLSAFCIAFSRECWDDIELIDEMVLENIGRPPEGTDIVSTLIVNTAWMTDVSHSWSTRVLSFVKARYFHFYRRLKWTFVGIMVVSTLDICSTFFAVIQQDRLSLSLSQYSAINVVVSASVGYLTSPAPHELHPAELLYTGVQQFKNKWVIFPLHMFVEALVFLGVFVGTFAASSTVFSSITLAALSGLVVSVGGHWLCSHLQLTVETHMRMQLTATCALLFCLFLITYASMISLFSIYHYFDSIEAAFCLASLAGIFFLAASELFLMWEPTREIGLLLQRRVTNASENWQQEPLRSFLELFTWFAVICGSFAMYDDLVLALQLGTLSGIAVTLSGEFFRKNRSKFIPWGKDYLADEKRVAAPLSPVGGLVGDPDRARPLPVMLLFAYIGSGTFHWIFDNMRSLEVTVLLATIAGIAFLCFADMLVLFKPTRWAGVILQDRFINVKQNWREYPVRSFVELGCFMGVIYGSHAIYDDLIVAVQVGTLSGILVTLGGEQLRNCARSIPLNESDREVLEKSQILPLPVMGLLGLVGAVAFNIIYTHLRRIEVAFVLATTSGVIFALIGDMFVIWTPTRKVGMILQERLLFFKMNFTCHTCRSWMEVASLCCGWYLSYNLIWPEDLLIAIQFGTTTGILACVSGELTMEYVAKAERRLIANASAKLAQNLQKDSLFFSLPYEIQFRVAHFLTAEDLLVVRATCSRVNSMLKAESARFWLHASLRRTKRDQRGRTRDHEINHRMGNRARSLVYEAITLVLPMIVGTRNPAQILTSRNEVNRALKWVYLNANWIRKQNLPPMHNETEIGGSTLIVLKAGDIAFDVFRYMPDKSSLGIIINRNEDFAIEQVHVPLSVYDMIQRDPFSFVAAETLSTLEVFSTWHLTVVAFAAMTLIFIGQIINDLLRAYMMGSETIWI